MINFYRAWKDEKESEPKKKKPKGAYKCVVCGKRVNGLKDHMNQTHGQGTYQKFIQAEEILKERQRQELLKIMGI